MSRLRGGGKRVIKKSTKNEKIETLLTTARHKRQMVSHSIDHLLTPMLNNEKFIINTLENMSLDMLKDLKDKTSVITYARDRQLVEVSLPFFVPEVKKIEQQIEILEKTKEAMVATLSHSFAREYHGDLRYDFRGFFNKIDDEIGKRVEVSEKVKFNKMMEDEISRRVEARVAKAIADQGGASINNNMTDE